MAELALITAIYGGYDHLKDPTPQVGDVDCVCFTDDPNLRSDVWRVVYWPKPQMPPFLAAKAPKVLPMRHVDAAASVWVDGSVRVQSPTFTVEACEAARDGVATWPHPWNRSVFAEMEEGHRQKRYQGQRLVEQVTKFYADGMPAGLTPRHTAVVARAHNESTERMGFEWDHQFEWSISDQIGFVWACWVSGVPMYDLPMDQAFLQGFRTANRDDRWLTHHAHAAKGMYA